MEEENKEVIQEEQQHEDTNIVQTIIQNGVSREELKEMLQEVLKPQQSDRSEIEKAEKEYFRSHLKY